MEPDVVVVEHPKSEAGALARRIGVLVVVLTALGLAGGVFIVESLADDARDSLAVSRSALEAIGETVNLVDDVAADTSASLDAASDSVAQVSATVGEAVTTLESVAHFLETELPETLETVQMSMPAAIQTANAVDGTLRTLSLFGVDYDPDEPFGESLSRVSTALAALPEEVRAQSDALRQLVPSASRLAEETDDLSASMADLEGSLGGFTALTGDYEATLAEAETTIASTNSSIDSSIWMLRAIVVIAGLVGVIAGVAITTLGTQVNTLAARLDTLDLRREPETIETAT